MDSGEKLQANEKRDSGFLGRGLLFVIYFNLCLRPLASLLSQSLSKSVAYGLAVALLSLGGYPIYRWRSHSLPPPWLRRWTFLKWFLFCMGMGVAAYLLDRYLPLNGN
jgi:hypothetical protein